MNDISRAAVARRDCAASIYWEMLWDLCGLCQILNGLHADCLNVAPARLLAADGFCFAGVAARRLKLEEEMMLQEFKNFAMRGSLIDLAIGVIIGVAFGKIIDSLVNDIIMPVIGRVTGGLDFTNYFIGLTRTRARLRPTTPPRRRAPLLVTATSSPSR